MNLEKINILLVEDDQVNQFLVSSFLRKWGMNLTVANNGQEAITLIQSKNFHLVLMDIQMPGMDGLETTATIRMIDDLYYKTVPIIAFSADTQNFRNSAIQHGITDFIAKTFEPEELRNKINEYTRVATSPRPILMDFESYTDGDQAFKVELISLLIGNLQELQRSLFNTVSKGSDIFFAICHKVKPTLSMLQDQELESILEELKTLINGRQEKMIVAFHEKQGQFNKLCNNIIGSLATESNKSLTRKSA
jgi:CheY-like chemotaxis protein